jgi:DNA-binding response OmpR family regulator
MRILIVEDHSRLALTIKGSLEQHGYAVDVAGTASEGQALALAVRHDAIILDVTLPDRDGVELCRQLRRQKIAAPIVMLTELAATADKVAGLDAGADDYLTKPFQLDELLARLRSLTRRSHAKTGTTLRSGDLVMDLDAHQATVGGANVRLSAKEFALLEYLLRNPRLLLTRTMIARNVWDMNYQSGSNVIDVYVSALRRKIDRGRRRSRIQTVIGSGYRFIDGPEGKDAPVRQEPAT